ncbi:hypothetical protein BH23PLA1_BH23PLA1_28230 [soil metagenome]
MVTETWKGRPVCIIACMQSFNSPYIPLQYQYKTTHVQPARGKEREGHDFLPGLIHLPRPGTRFLTVPPGICMPTRTSGTSFTTGMKVCPPPHPRQGVGRADHTHEPAASIHFSDPTNGTGEVEGTETTRPTFPTPETELRIERLQEPESDNDNVQKQGLNPYHQSGDFYFMASQESSPKGHSPTTSPRSNLTPAGYKNVRVFVSKHLHFQLISHSAASQMSLQDFVVAWLERATPLTPTPAPQRQIALEPAPGHRLAHDAQGGQGLAKGPGAAQEQREPARDQRPAQGPLGVPGQAVGPCAALSSEASAPSRQDHAPDLALNRSSPTTKQAPSPAGQDPDHAGAERTRPR